MRMKFKNIFKKKKRNIFVNNLIGVVELTDVAMENGVDDKFNKIIKIFEGVKKEGNEIIWGKLIEEIPYSKEAVISLEEVKKIPIVFKKQIYVDFLEEEFTGGIIN